MPSYTRWTTQIDLIKLRPPERIDKTADRPTVAYARVSSHDQKEDLQRQVHMLEIYCSAKGWTFLTIKDLGSGMNYHKRGLKQLLEQIMNGQIGRLVLTHKDRRGNYEFFNSCSSVNSRQRGSICRAK